MNFKKNNNTLFFAKVSIHLSPTTSSYPVAPNNYGYWAYDDTDEGYDQRPSFDWVELDPNYGGSGAIHYQLDDDDHVDVELPFTFQYHGVDYDQITISSTAGPLSKSVILTTLEYVHSDVYGTKVYACSIFR